MRVFSRQDVQKVYLMMGDDCNTACRHCVLTPVSKVRTTYQDEESFAKVVEFIRQLARQRRLKQGCANNGETAVIFWGGEPLLYFPWMQKVISLLGDELSYAVISNGMLLTEEMASFFNEHEVHYVVSNDGADTANVRESNVFEDVRQLELLRKLKHLSVDSVLSCYNFDYFRLWDYLDEKLGRQVPAFFEFLHVNWEMPDDLYRYDFDAYERLMQRVIEAAYEELRGGNRFGRAYGVIEPVVLALMRLVEGKVHPGYFPACSQVRLFYNVDLAGNVYACHGNSLRIGRIEDEHAELLARYDSEMQKLLTDHDCRDCEIWEVCRGGCPFTLRQHEAQAFYCRLRKIQVEYCARFLAMFAQPGNQGGQQ